jgi:hypothetical protein
MGFKQWVAAALALGALSACDERAVEADCKEACENVTRLYLGAVDQQVASQETLKQMGESGAAMAKEMASMQLEFMRHECERECKAKASKRQATCLKEAKTPEEASACN